MNGNDFRSVGLELTLDDFQKVSDAVPFLADLKPSGKYVMEDIHKVRLLLNRCAYYLFVFNWSVCKFCCLIFR